MVQATTPHFSALCWQDLLSPKPYGWVQRSRACHARSFDSADIPRKARDSTSRRVRVAKATFSLSDIFEMRRTRSENVQLYKFSSPFGLCRD